MIEMAEARRRVDRLRVRDGYPPLSDVQWRDAEKLLRFRQWRQQLARKGEE